MKKDLGIPILHVTHDLNEADRLGDRVIAVEKGRITPDWLTRQQHPLQQSLSVSPLYS